MAKHNTKNSTNSNPNQVAAKSSSGHWEKLKAHMQARVLAKKILEQANDHTKEITEAGEQAANKLESSTVGKRVVARREAKEAKASEIKANAVQAVEQTKNVLLEKGWSVKGSMWSKPQANKTASGTGKAKLHSAVNKLSMIRAFANAAQGNKSSDQHSNAASVTSVTPSKSK